MRTRFLPFHFAPVCDLYDVTNHQSITHATPNKKMKWLSKDIFFKIQGKKRNKNQLLGCTLRRHGPNTLLLEALVF